MTDESQTGSNTEDARIDAALRELLAPAAKPRVRTGFDRRLAHAVAADLESRRQSRALRRVMRVYWLAAALGSAAILWQFQDRLLSGPGLWFALGGLATFVGAGLSLSILAALPVGLRRRDRAGS